MSQLTELARETAPVPSHAGRTALEHVCVVGLGKLGAPLAACLASKGFWTIGVDIDPSTVHTICDGRAPVSEPGLQSLLDRHGGRLTASLDCGATVAASDATFVVVPTPTGQDGTFSLCDLTKAVRAVGAALRTKADFHVVVIVSTGMPMAMTRDIDRKSGG